MATEINLKNLPEGFQTIISNGKHAILGDEPIKSKGTDLGFAPTELVLAGLGMCKVATIRYIARLKGWEIRDVNARLSQEVNRGENKKLSTRVKVRIDIEGNITEEQRQELLSQADNCYVHRLIESDWHIENATDLNEEIQNELLTA
ncbi:OsmC family protein [Algoriphagus limi]|uniref:OsmC family protein n=1 Tax=Algoriphagus limi TaxID=2975273 RepID=A0ABT2GAD9_9BACT|nr:OsmC family protein [Algoriphagus limi]MCS5490897.1 OsmC family protein [Algoriphagus limi]